MGMKNVSIRRSVLGCAALAGLAPGTLVQSAHAETTSADEVRAIVAEMMADAEGRSSLHSTGGSVRYKSGFRIEDPGGASLRINGLIQFRYAYNSDIENGTDDSNAGGFQFRRTRLDFRGTLPDNLLSFRIRGEFGRSDGVFDLIDAFVQRDFGNGWSLRLGQFTPGFEREFNFAPHSLLTIERSIVSNAFRINRTQGVRADYEADRFRASLQFSDGAGTLNTDYTSTIEADFSFTARGEWRLGDAPWDQYTTNSGMPGDAFGVLLGVAGHYQQEGRIPAVWGLTGTRDLYQYTADASFEGDGWNLLGAVVGRVIEGNDDDVHDLGVTVQGGFFIGTEWEPYARYARIIPGSRTGGNDDDFDQITLGTNWYPRNGSRALRVSGEVTYFPQTQADSSAAISPSTSFGLLGDDEGDQFNILFQVQLIF